MSGDCFVDVKVVRCVSGSAYSSQLPVWSETEQNTVMERCKH